MQDLRRRGSYTGRTPNLSCTSFLVNLSLQLTYSFSIFQSYFLGAEIFSLFINSAQGNFSHLWRNHETWKQQVKEEKQVTQILSTLHNKELIIFKSKRRPVCFLNPTIMKNFQSYKQVLSYPKFWLLLVTIFFFF